MAIIVNLSCECRCIVVSSSENNYITRLRFQGFAEFLTRLRNVFAILRLPLIT